MNVKLHLVNENKEHQLEMPEPAKASETLMELNIPPDTVIITRGGRPIPLDTPLEDGDKLDVIRVVSGG